MKKIKYQKPAARNFIGLSAAEGACSSAGLSASGSTCTKGDGTQWCSDGGAASITGNPGFCVNGPVAGNCLTNGTIAGG